MPDPDLEMGGGGSSRLIDKGGGRSPKKIFLSLQASVWSKNKERGGPPAPHLDPPLIYLPSPFST